MTSKFRRALLAAAVTGTTLAASATGASAATIFLGGGNLVFEGAGAADNDVTFSQPNPASVRIARDPSDGDPITPPPPPCVQNTMGVDYTCPAATVTVNGNAGNDEFDANAVATIPFTLNGGTGSDIMDGGKRGDTLNGGPGDDFLRGDEGNDVVNGDAGNDGLNGGDENDTLNGGEDDDVLLDGTGNDTSRGDGGNDTFLGLPGNDDMQGGPGFDTALVLFLLDPRPPAIVSLDDVANDKLSGFDPDEADNVRSDIEAVSAEPDPTVAAFGGGTGDPSPPGDDTFTGNARANSLNGGQGNDTLDGLTGNDLVLGGQGNDTIKARDGFADFVNCGAGTDSAEVDTLDTVEECETVNRADVGNANDVPEIPEDAPPAIALTGPASGALLRTTAPTVLTATATDDKGVAQVLFIDDERIVCADAAAPYTCDYRPRGEDVGRNTLVAIAVDTAQQTASTTRAFNVDRFNVASITGAVTPARDLRAPFAFRTAGRVRLPVGVTPALGCADGQVSIQVKAGAKTISTRRADVRRDCTFSSTVRFADRKRFTRNGRLRFTLRFTGNEVLNRSAAIARNIRTRS